MSIPRVTPDVGATTDRSPPPGEVQNPGGAVTLDDRVIDPWHVPHAHMDMLLEAIFGQIM